MIYLDYNATTPLCQEVCQAMRDILVAQGNDPLQVNLCWGNPSSGHAFGVVAKHRLEQARDQIANAIGANPLDVIFTSGGTESINHAIKGACFHELHKAKEQSVQAKLSQKNHIITSSIEHVAVTETIDYMVKHFGFKKTVVDVDRDGRVNVQDVMDAITEKTLLVTIMLANNEIGSIQPIAEIGTRLKEEGLDVLLHTDASQAVGKIPVNVNELKVDMLTLAGHKIYGPKGAGASFMRKETCQDKIDKFMHGANHERGIRAGTENVLLAVGLGTACEVFARSLKEEMEHLQGLRDQLQDLLTSKCERMGVACHVNGHPQHRLPNTLSISFKGFSSVEILQMISNDVCCSAGAACHTGGDKLAISHVLRAINLDPEFARGTLRLSVGRYTTVQHISDATNHIINALANIQKAREGKFQEDAEVEVPTKLEYFDDTYKFESTAKIVAVQPSDGEYKMAEEVDSERFFMVLDQTIFHPQGGGQPSDVGAIISPFTNEKFTVEFAEKVGARVFHHGYFSEGIKDAFKIGSKVKLVIDEEVRRYHARLHSAAHLIDQAMLITGYNMKATKGSHFPNNSSVEYDGTIPAEDKEVLQVKLEETLSNLVAQSIPTKVLDVPIGEASKHCLPGQEPLGPMDDLTRIVIVGGNQGCPCGGTHVENTRELGQITIRKLSNRKGQFKISYELDK